MDATTSHILVPVDYSDKSVFSLKMASRIQQTLGGKITVINVLKGVNPIWSNFFTDSERSALLDKLHQHLQEFCGKYLQECDNGVTFCIEKGPLCDTILGKAQDIKASLIIMGTSTVDNIKKWIIGTNALRIVSEAHCPVITLKKDLDVGSIKNIVLPLDITKETREKTVEAVMLAKAFGAKIHVVSAYTMDDDSIMTRLERQLDQVLDFVKDHNVEVSGDILKVDDRVDSVIDFIKTRKADLIVITTHQQLEIIPSFIGSFAKDIIRLANIPVMSIVPKIKHHLVFKMPAS